LPVGPSAAAARWCGVGPEGAVRHLRLARDRRLAPAGRTSEDTAQPGPARWIAPMTPAGGWTAVKNAMRAELRALTTVHASERPWQSRSPRRSRRACRCSPARSSTAWTSAWCRRSAGSCSCACARRRFATAWYRSWPARSRWPRATRSGSWASSSRRSW